MVQGRAIAQGTSRGQIIAPGIQLLQEVLMGQAQPRGRHMGQVLHIVDRLLGEGQDLHPEEPMIQGRPLHLGDL